MRIGIFGGTFNPIHKAHIYMAEKCKESLELDGILLIPTYLPPHKDAENLAAPEQRLEMCELAARNHTGFMVSDYEIQQGGKSYTYNTLEHFKDKSPQWEIYLLMGGDMFLTLDEWKNPDRIFRSATIVGVARQQGELEKLICKKNSLDKLGATSIVLDIPIMPMSSTEIRKRVFEGKDISEFVAPSVNEYILTNNLYKRSN